MAIRENPLHAPPAAPFKPPTPQTFGAAPVHMAGRVSPGGMNSYLGHFAQPKNLISGHNSGGHPKGQHPGFAAVEAKIGKEKGIRNPGAVLAAATRRASPAAKRANPRLKRVKG